MKGKTQFSREFREKMAKEAIESGNTAATAKKNNLDVRNLYSWVKSYKNRGLDLERKSTKKLLKELEESRMEIAILRELLKKTTNVLIQD